MTSSEASVFNDNSDLIFFVIASVYSESSDASILSVSSVTMCFQ